MSTIKMKNMKKNVVIITVLLLLLTFCKKEDASIDNISDSTRGGVTNSLCLQSVMNQKWGQKESLDIIRGTSSNQWAELIEFRNNSFIEYKYNYTVCYDTLVNSRVDYGQAPSYTDTSTLCNTWVYVPSSGFNYYQLEENKGDSIKIYHYWYGQTSANYSAWYYKF